MDKKQLEALNNLSGAIEYLAEVMQTRDDKSKDDDKKSIFSKFFSGKADNEQIKEISESIKSLKDDNKQILDNQKELLKIAKEKKSEKGGLFEKIGDKKNLTNIKDGVKTVVLIAGGIMAIGAAFKLVGDVDFASVIALSVSLPLVAIAFEKIAQLKGLTPRTILTTMLVILGMSTSILLSSHILSGVRPLSISQTITSIGIAGMFALIMVSIKDMAKSMKGIDVKSLVMLPLVLVTASMAIAASSYVLNGIQPISDPLPKFLTAIGISATFILLSYALKPILSSMKNIDIGKLALMPLVFITMSMAVVGASWVLQNLVPIPDSQLMGYVKTSLAIAISSLVLGVSMAVIARILSPTQAIKGGLSLVIMSGAIALSSQLLALGQYDTYPSVGFALGFGLSILLMTAPIIAMGLVSPLVIASGSAGLLIATGALVAASYIIAKINPELFKPGGVMYKMADTFVYFINKLKGPVVGFIKEVMPVVGKFISDVVSNILPGVAKVIEAITPVVDAVGNVITKIGNAIGGVIEKIGNVIQTVAGSINNFINTFTDSIIKLSEVDAGKLLAVAGSITAVLLAVGGGGVAAGIGALVSSATGSGLDDIVKKLTQFTSLEPTLTKMASAFDTLSKSVLGLTTNLSKLDTNQLNGLKLITTQVVLLSTIDSGDLEDTLNLLEDKNTSIKDLMNTIKNEVLNLTGSNLSTNVQPTQSIAVTRLDSGSKTSLDDLKSEMVKMNGFLSSISTNTKKYADYINEMRAGKKVKLDH